MKPEATSLAEELKGNAHEQNAFRHACARYDDGDHEGGIKLLSAILRERPLHLGALKRLGYALYSKEAYVLAASPLVSAAMLDASDPEPAYFAACCMVQSDTPELARSLLKAAEEIASRSPLQSALGHRARQLLATLPSSP